MPLAAVPVVIIVCAAPSDPAPSHGRGVRGRDDREPRRSGGAAIRSARPARRSRGERPRVPRAAVAGRVRSAVNDDYGRRAGWAPSDAKPSVATARPARAPLQLINGLRIRSWLSTPGRDVEVWPFAPEPPQAPVELDCGTIGRGPAVSPNPASRVASLICPPRRSPARCSPISRLRAFRGSESPGAPRFVDELARDTGWPRDRRRSVAEEYRRFLWIARTPTDLVSPSPEVDQAWHLHLLDTRSYWDGAVPEVLGRALHHERGRAGWCGARASTRPIGGRSPRTAPPSASRRRTCGRRRRTATPNPPPGTSRGGRAPPGGWRSSPSRALAVGAVLARRELAQAFFALSDVWFLVGVCALVALMTLWASPVRRRALQPDDAPSEAELAALDRRPRLPHERAARRARRRAHRAGGVGSAGRRPGARGVRPADGAERPPDTALQRLVLASVRARPRGHIDDQLPSRRQVQALVEPALIAGGFLVSAGSRAAVDALTFGTPVAALAAILLRCALVARPSPVLGLSFVLLPLVAALVTLPFVGPSPATGRGALALARRKAQVLAPAPEHARRRGLRRAGGAVRAVGAPGEHAGAARRPAHPAPEHDPGLRRVRRLISAQRHRLIAVITASRAGRSRRSMASPWRTTGAIAFGTSAAASASSCSARSKVCPVSRRNAIAAQL